jgi:hypothetical protein
MQSFAVARHDSARFLPAMLKREKPELRQSRGFSVSENAENAAFFVKFVEQKIHFKCK